MLAGLLIIIVGVVFLLQNLGYIGSNVWDVIWPLFIIMAGLSMVFRRTSAKDLFKKIKRK